MFDRIIMNIIEMSLQIIFVAYLMFPKTSLPNTHFTFACS